MSPKKYTNEEWLADLNTDGSRQQEALGELRKILLKGLKAALIGRVKTSGREFDELAEDFVQEALVIILKKLDSFKGLSQFTTWAHKICIHLALTELRRLRWMDLSLTTITEKGYQLTDSHSSSEKQIIEKGQLNWLKQIMRQELSEKQWTAMSAVIFMNIPLEETARAMGSNRNAMYKLLHDARLKIKNRIIREGLTMNEILNESGF